MTADFPIRGLCQKPLSPDTVRIRGVEFVWRFVTHILPKGLKRVRYYGMFFCQRREADLARCRELLGVTADRDDDQDAMTEQEREEADRMKGPLCPYCEVETLYVRELAPLGGWRSRRSTTKGMPRRYAEGAPTSSPARSQPP